MERLRQVHQGPPLNRAMINHLANLAMFTGYWKGKYFREGIKQQNVGRITIEKELKRLHK